MKKIIFALLFFALTGNLFSQTTFKGGDLQFWGTVYLKYQFNLRHSLTFRAETRGRDNLTTLRHYSGELKYAFHPQKWYQIAAGFRYVNKNYGEIEHKLFGDIHFFHSFGSFSVAYRQRVQYEYTPPYQTENATDDWQSRNKFWVKYDSLGNFTPYLAAEVRWQIGGNLRPELNNKFHRARYEAGMYYSINCKHAVCLFGILQHEWNLPVPKQKVIYAIGLTYFYKIAWKLCEDEHIKYDAAE